MNATSTYKKSTLAFFFVMIAAALFLASFLVANAQTNGSIPKNLSGYAWSSTIGWVSLTCQNESTCGNSNYWVGVKNNGEIGGYAWSDNIGWISFNRSDLSGCPSGACEAAFNNTTGEVTGWARALAGTDNQNGGWDGWIYLGQSNRVGVTANGCDWSGNAWGSAQWKRNGVIGWLSFDGPGYGVTGEGVACQRADAATASLSANPTSITEGESTTLTWSSTNAMSCSGTNFNTGTSRSGSVTVSPSSDTTYSVTCTGPGGNGSDSVSVTVNPPTPSPTVDLNANPSSITEGGNTTLTWSSSNATSCSGTRFNTGGATSGSTSVSPSSDTTYILSCTGPGGSANDDVTVRVNAPSLPDLRAVTRNVSETATKGTFRFNGRIVNNGDANAPAHNSMLQICGGSSGSCAWQQRTTVSTGAIASGNRQEISANDVVARTGTHRYRFCADMDRSFNKTVTESNENNNCGSWKRFTSTGVATPDLTASNGGSVSGEIGSSITFNGNITNVGDAPTGSGFTNMLQICDSDCSYNDRQNVSTAALSAGETVAVSANDSITSEGTYRYRFCADLNTSFNGTIDESVENNNCSAWANVTVATSPSISFSANPSTIIQGQRSDLVWDADDAGNCTSSDFNIPGNRTDGTTRVAPSSTTTYEITCTGIGGSTTDSATITVLAPTTANLSASPTEIALGDSTTLSWSSSNASSCTGTGFGTGGTTSGSASVSPSNDATYQVECAGPGGTDTDIAQVTVVQPSVSITADEDRVDVGDNVTLQWSANDVLSCAINGPDISRNQTSPGPGTGDLSGTQSVQIDGRSEFTIVCQATGGPVEDSTIVNVVPLFREF